MMYRAKNSRLQKQLADPKLRVRTFGMNRAQKIGARLDEFAAASTLVDISRFPPARLHELVGEKQGLFAVDISKNFRLIFAGFDLEHEQSTIPSDNVIVVFVSVEDYH